MAFSCSNYFESTFPFNVFFCFQLSTVQPAPPYNAAEAPWCVPQVYAAALSVLGAMSDQPEFCRAVTERKGGLARILATMPQSGGTVDEAAVLMAHMVELGMTTELCLPTMETAVSRCGLNTSG